MATDTVTLKHRSRTPRKRSEAQAGVIDRILNSAESVLRSHGYSGFSTRRVAQEAGIALGNLTYHYPTKAELIRALIGRLMPKYLERFEQSLLTPSGGLEAVVRWLLAESVNEEAMWLFRELWAMALHDQDVRVSIDDFYDDMMERVINRLIATHPKADPREISDLVHLVAMMSEGSSVIYGTRRSRSSSHQRVIDLAARIVRMSVPE